MNNDIKKYIEQYPIEVQKKLNELYSIIKEVVPENTTEKISWQMPTFFLKGNLVHFAAHKNHVGFYPGASGIEKFKDSLAKLKYSKGAIQFNINKPLPKALIQKIVKFRVNENTKIENNKINNKIYEFESKIKKVPDLDAAYIEVPFDIRKEFGKGRVKVTATFDNVIYDGSIVNMGVKNEDNSICYIIGIRKNIRKKINKQHGDTIKVTIKERK